MNIVTAMRAGWTLNEATRYHREGYIDDADFELYCFYWRNGAPRFSDECARYEIR